MLRDLPLQDGGGSYHVVVEAPRGSAVKLKYDERTGVFVWSRALPLGVTYPHDFGFVPRTLSGDGDALDVMLLSGVASYPGVVVPSRVIGTLRVEQQRPGQEVKRNDRVLAVPVNAHRLAHVVDIGDVAQRVRDELQAFFAASLVLTGKTVCFRGWADAAESTALIADAHSRYQSA